MASRQSVDATQVIKAAPEEFSAALAWADALGLVLRPKASIARRRDGGTTVTVRWQEPKGTLSQTVTLRLPPVPRKG